MTDDLIAQLRYGYPSPEESHEAADEIERLRAVIAEALAVGGIYYAKWGPAAEMREILSRVPQGAAEPVDDDWEYGALYGPTGYSPNTGPSLAEAEAIIEQWKGVGQIVRRRPEREPGDWEPYRG